MAERMDRNLALEVVRVTEWAALAASRLMGRGRWTRCAAP
jgi:fructose-1,6-bisphosphatase/sedoheptulose 1,7-bisphosphatase-like protein